MRVVVVAANDFPEAVFSNPGAADVFIKKRTKENERVRNLDSMARKIYRKAYDFEVLDECPP
jgi:hypothetical protein